MFSILKKLLLLLLLSLGFVGTSYAHDEIIDRQALEKEIAEYELAKQLALEEAREKEIAEFETELAAELAAQEMMAEIESDMARQAALEAFAQALWKEKRIGGTKPIPFHRAKRLWVADIATKVKSYWNYSGADDDWSCTVYVQQDVDGNVEAVNIQNCNTGNSDNALMADDKARSFKNSIERAVYKASPLPIAPDDAVFDRELMFYFRAI
jgi:colicin import membrane protein